MKQPRRSVSVSAVDTAVAATLDSRAMPGDEPSTCQPPATFCDPELERDFIAYCQLAAPIALTTEAMEAKREELLKVASRHVRLKEFDSPHAESSICGRRILEDLGETSEVALSLRPERYLFSTLCATRLISAAEEQSLLKRHHYYKHLAYQMLVRPTIDQWALARAEGLLRAAHWHRSQIIQANLRLVVSIVKRLPGAQNNLDELVSDGIIGLMRALDAFDPDRGYRFCTYATTVIRRECCARSQERQDERTQFASPSILRLLSTDAGMLEGTADRAHWIKWRQRLLQMIGNLSRREQVIIRSRYCLGAHRNVKTLQRLADALKISKERVRQLEHNALAKLRRWADAELVSTAEHS